MPSRRAIFSTMRLSSDSRARHPFIHFKPSQLMRGQSQRLPIRVR